MKYIDREGNVTTEDSGQDKLLKFLYGNAPGRGLLRFLVRPSVSKAGGWLLDTGCSKVLIGPFIKRNAIDMSQFEERKFRSYNAFFTRKIKSSCRPLPKEEGVFFSPCDGKLSVYPIGADRKFFIKNTGYTLESLLRSRRLARYYRGGQALVFRLTVDDYHRFCYVDDGRKSRNYRIPGVFHTVNPAANEVYPIYKENTREFSLLKSRHFGTVLMMEVGALLVGKITNHHEEREVKRGQEKGLFEFGGSTIVVLLRKDRVAVDRQLIDNTENGFETIVRMGERIGEAKGPAY